ncbi:MAG: tyrosine-type recombinase/integrase [Turicibacter sp.]|nr:tyrosine-type recombinase/integrase [Turicibacter sp.]
MALNNQAIKPYETATGKKGYVAKGAYIGVDALTGKEVRREIRGATKKEVRLKYDRLVVDFRNGGNTVKEKAQTLTFGQLIDLWYDDYKNTVTIGTQNNMKGFLNAYLRPQLGDYKLEKLSPVVIQIHINKQANLSNQHEKEGNRPNGSGKAFKNMASTINRIFVYGKENGLCSFNPATELRTPKTKRAPKKEIQYLKKNQLSDFLKAVTPSYNDSYHIANIKTCLYLLPKSGLRISEALALEWDDIDFEENTVKVSKTLIREVGKGTHLQNHPKSVASNRTIDMDSGTITLLANLKRLQLEKCLLLGLPRLPHVFWNFSKGNYFTRTILSSAYRNQLESLGLPPYGIHSLRHTFASMNLNAGVGYKIIQAQLGHEKLSITMDLYSHLEPSTKKDSVGIVQAYLNS